MIPPSETIGSGLLLTTARFVGSADGDVDSVDGLDGVTVTHDDVGEYTVDVETGTGELLACWASLHSDTVALVRTGAISVDTGVSSFALTAFASDLTDETAADLDATDTVSLLLLIRKNTQDFDNV